ncbi:MULTISPECIES: DUF3043 domain-containing protein [unclassified Rhodococcus (in: high G+C Gram-positive bacteria)]|uniref:DUF3043 domain-containing protein n=1 Tax=unclassified Rhodococcus (in: high G+C Gram-positive bacteria) TaxID=192944 RepID=UPI000486C4E0|nr:hypothetical protein ASG69_05800 [Rhodococcus sp. Leaf225]KQU44566.1 hypothetical protein ASH03_11340 [Rhodococcus sp. Leaf258]
MKLPFGKSSEKSDTQTPVDHESTSLDESTAQTRGNVSLGKGRPTPSRREAEGRRRGPVAPAPLTAKEARARRKATRGSKDERKAASAERRAKAADQRARMMAGEDKFLLPRDKGPVRAYARDLVDSRRNFVGLFMPMALILLVALFLSPEVQSIVTLALFIMMIFMGIDGYLLGRRVNNKVRDRFPETPDGGFKLGWYSFVRASQVRKMRAPKPRVGPGDAV